MSFSPSFCVAVGAAPRLVRRNFRVRPYPRHRVNMRALGCQLGCQTRHLFMLPPGALQVNRVTLVMEKFCPGVIRPRARVEPFTGRFFWERNWRGEDVILSAAKDLSPGSAQILRCAQNDRRDWRVSKTLPVKDTPRGCPGKGWSAAFPAVVLLSACGAKPSRSSAGSSSLRRVTLVAERVARAGGEVVQGVEGACHLG
jgi:hypothetical protein